VLRIGRICSESLLRRFRRKELMAIEILRTGQVVIESDDFPRMWSITAARRAHASRRW
jgi:hypothetical protein